MTDEGSTDPEPSGENGGTAPPYRSSLPELESEHLDRVLDLFEHNKEEIAHECWRRLVQEDDAATRLEEARISQSDIEGVFISSIEALDAEGKRRDGSELPSFGRRCAEAKVPLPALIDVFEAYAAVLQPNLVREVGDTVADTDASSERCRTEFEAGIRRLRLIERIKLRDIQAAAAEYLDASRKPTASASVERVDDRLAELTGAHLKPARSTATVVERASEDVCGLVEDQTARTKRIADELSSLSATVEEIASTASEVNRTSDRAQQFADEGSESADDAIAAMRDIEAAVADVSTDMETLQSQVEEITEFTAVLDGIADQTNILALNASIEAARADEGAEGFGVVAEEIKTLANEAKGNAQEIEETVERVRTDVESTAASLENATENVTNGITRVERTIEHLDDIAETVRESAQGIAEVSKATDEQAATTEELTSMVEDVAERADQVQAEIDKITAANAEQVNSLDELGAAIEELRAEL